jgi:hypothetical protein
VGNPFVVARRPSVVVVARNQFVEVVAKKFDAVEGENQVAAAAAVVAKTMRRAGVQLAAVEVRPKGC